MPINDLDELRRRAGTAYARWRACDALRPRGAVVDEECTRLKHELDVAARLLFLASRSLVSIGPS